MQKLTDEQYECLDSAFGGGLLNALYDYNFECCWCDKEEAEKEYENIKKCYEMLGAEPPVLRETKEGWDLVYEEYTE